MTEPERADAVIRDDSATFVNMECHMVRTTIPTAVYKKLPDKEERKLHPKTRFKAVVHLVMANAYWLGDVDGMALGSNARLNVLLLKKRGRKEKQKILTLQEKIILMKPASERTPDEKKQLSMIIGGLKCFRRYPEDVQKKLAAATYYKFYGPGRVVVRQGHRAEALYFILSGEVTVSITCWDGLIEEIVTSDVGTMRPGDMFGEVSLLHDIPRTATCTTATMVELLCLMKEDFANVLQVSLQHHWDDCKRAMQQFPYFNGWDEVAVRECCILSKLKSYGPDQMMLGDGVGQPNYAYFVLQGTCRVVQNVRFAVRLVRGHRKYRLFPEVDTHLKEGETLERFFVQVCLMDKGSCFGLGEDMQDRRVIALSKVECLLIPQYWLMQHNRANIWVRIRQFLDQNIPSQDQIFKAFLEHRKWLQYRQELVREIVSRKKIPNNTTIHDVPYSLRINSDTIPDRPGY